MSNSQRGGTLSGVSRGSLIVVGGGIIGLFTALYAQQDGWEVSVLEAGFLGSGAARGNGGWICPALSKPMAGPGMVKHAVLDSLRPDAAVRLHVPPRRSTARWVGRFARLCNEGDLRRTWRVAAALSEASFTEWQRLAERGVSLPIGRTGNLVLFRDHLQAKHAFEAAQETRTLGQVAPDRLLDGEQVRALEPSVSEAVVAGYLWPDQWFVDPNVLVETLIAAVRSAGTHVVEHTPVRTISEENGVAVCRTDAGTVTADAVLIATGAQIAELTRALGVVVPVIHGKGYSFDVPAQTLPQQPLNLPTSHIAVTPLENGRLRVAGGMEFDRDNLRLNAAGIRRIHRGATAYLRGVDWDDRRNEWVGSRPMSPDTLPLVGPVHAGSRVFIATGHGTMGLTQGPGTAHLVTEALTGTLPGWAHAFDPLRFSR